jgi:hypothetical protein
MFIRYTIQTAMTTCLEFDGFRNISLNITHSMGKHELTPYVLKENPALTIINLDLKLF